ncbi:MAG: hypothetical protein KDE53_24880, partial [Caldilineaceae bacterium]|nr:hypothetical protein [Caldilineaceae bacterium]
QNTNVRQAPTLDACRIGRIPRGTLVAITGVVSDAITGTPTIAISTTARLNLPDDTVINRAIFSETIAVTTTTATAATLIPTLVPTAEPPSTRAESSAPAAAVAATGSQVGYVEDIQPIFQRTCIACHSSVVRQLNLQVTAYDPLMAGSSNGPVVIPGDSAASRLWEMVDSGKMPLIGELKPDEKTLIRQWIDSGAPERRTATMDHDQQANNATASNPAATVASSSAAASPDNTEIAGTESRTGDGESAALWLTVAEESIDPVPDICTDPLDEPAQVVSADLILPISCGVQPRAAQLQRLLQSLAIVPTASRPLPTTAAEAGAFAAAPDVEVSAPPAAAAPPVAAVPQAGLQANALGLDAPADGDPWLTPRGGFCIDQHFNQNERAVTSLAFAPDGRLFIALDSRLDGPQDTNILYDAYHPSRSIVVYDPSTRFTPNEIMNESSRITGMAYADGALFLNRAGEMGWIPDGGSYRTLAGGFAVNSQLFHANNGIAITNGYIYISAGGVRDGYSDGPIEGIGEAGAQNVVSGGNRFAARIIRAPLSRLINEYNIELFETAARGVRNPYGITVDPAGRIWFTDNGATNVPENVSAGDEVNLYLPSSSPPGTPEENTPYYGFPLALTSPQPWYIGPVVDLYNTSAPTGITWAYGTIFFGQYGRNPGLYRLGRVADGRVIAERVMLVWPLLALATAPDGALWVGTGSGG